MVKRKIGWIAQARFEPFLRESDGDAETAWRLYEWNARVSSALFECFHHAEVLLRNAMMDQLRQIHPLEYPWHSSLPAVVEAARRKSVDRPASADQVISELSLGFWTELLKQSAANEELWRHTLRLAFPGSPGTRQAVFNAVSDLRLLRNRCAHQDSLLEADPAIELKKLLTLVEWIDPEARTWIESIETVSAEAAKRPVQPKRDVLVVPVAPEQGLRMYERVAAYVCPQNRSFASVEYIGFYSAQEIFPQSPKIEHIVIPARWTREEQQQLQLSDDLIDRRVAKVMGYGLANGWNAGEQLQVFLLSEPTANETLQRSGRAPIPHLQRGRGSAFVHNIRYFAHSALLAATSTEQL